MGPRYDSKKLNRNIIAGGIVVSGFITLFNSEVIPSYITPLFWQHGESEDIIREEILQMSENGIGSFIVESRPHPDFLGESWWETMDVIIDEAKKRNMKVWIFDDSAFPSGFGAGKIRDEHPVYLKIYLCERHIDAIGPLRGSSFLIKEWIQEGEKLVRIIAAKKIDRVDRIDAGTLIDLTDKVVEGILYWDVPLGDWRVFVFICTRNGGEEWTKDYINPLDPEPVREFINYVYEEHYRHYPDEFGKTIAGFFTDEPRFGNSSSYEATLGRIPMVLPYSDKLPAILNSEWKGDFGLMLPCLWYDAGFVTANVRYTYMNVVSRLYSDNFSEQIGNWCREHHVKLIGHVVEDNGAHARLGYGSGHFFRAIKGQDCSGLDVVYQVWPEYTSGKFSSPFGYLDAEFFYWGINKMASSAGHIDPKKGGTTVCEIFGSYGWQEGLKLMKWLTDHVCVRGVNRLIPHSFSPRYPDPDCPPHFYARGFNPQWRYFSVWSNYANRVCHLLSGGVHIAPVAVVYHAEAEWSGRYEPFEKVVKKLALSQIDCDIIPIDTLVDIDAILAENGQFQVNREKYKALIVPYAEYLPEKFAESLLELVNNKVPVIFMGDYPDKSCETGRRFETIMAKLKKNTYSMICTYDQLVQIITSFHLNDIEVTGYEENLRYYHYVNLDKDIYFFTNESRYKTVDTKVRFKKKYNPVGYDALEDIIYEPCYSAENEYISIGLNLGPYESTFIIFGNNENIKLENIIKKLNMRGLAQEFLIEGKWKVLTSSTEGYPDFLLGLGIDSLGNISAPDVLPCFSGTIRYEITFNSNEKMFGNRILLDMGEVFEIAEVKLNENDVGVRICPPYTIEVTQYIRKGQNLLQIDVTNTLAKMLGNNIYDRAMPQEPSGLIGPVKLLYEQKLM